ncbi:MAG: hypothetical protein ABI905_01525 [Betaproteobacteria bacterium]
MIASPVPKLNIANVFLGAILFPWHRRRDVAHALLVPMIFLVGVIVVWNETGASFDPGFAWVVSGVYAFLFILLAVKCHRLVLVDEPVEDAWTLPHWTRRETRFALWAVMVWGCCVAAFYVTTTVCGVIFPGLAGMASFIAPDDTAAIMKACEVAGNIAYWYVFGRFSLIFPAKALDKKGNLVRAWRYSRGNGWRLFAVVCVLPFCLSHLVSFLYRNEATLVEYLLLTALGVVFIAVEVTALSLAYRWLVQEPAQLHIET